MAAIRSSRSPSATTTNAIQFWHVNVNAPQGTLFPGNSISTAKYSIVTFLPKFLYEQFRRYSNIFFLIIALFQQIPDVSPTGRFTTLVPLICILTVSAIKEMIEDIRRHSLDSERNNRQVEILRKGEWQWGKWKSVNVGDFVKVQNDQFFPADLLLIASSEPLGICYIETSNLDGETNLKIRQALPETCTLLEIPDLTALTGFLECELPNKNLYEFMGRLQLNDGPVMPLGPDQILLRGSKLQNTSFIYGFVVYTGHDSKLMKNSTAVPLKRSTVDKRTNYQIILLFGLLITVALTSTSFSFFFVDHEALSWYIPEFKGFSDATLMEKVSTFLYTLLTFLVLFNTIIPISLTVTLEVVRFIQALFINWDPDMYHEETSTPSLARTSNLCEELGQISYIFSDKTGTLTRNIMEFKACSVLGKVYGPEDLKEGSNLLIENMITSDDVSVKEGIKEFLVLLALCHTVIPDSDEEGIENIMYNASSPDEKALVYQAMKMGFVFFKRTPKYLLINALGSEEKYDILNVLEFSSTRKRMSVILKEPDGKIKLYCKGADSMILERLQESSETDLQMITKTHLDEFSTQGLRTLCCAVAEVSPEVHEEWQKIFHAASTAIHDREQRLDEAAELIEKDMKLLGATAIEDKLQDEVPETIAALLEAGISVWVLTGDKQETAINIGYSCNLLNQQMELFLVNRKDMKTTKECIRQYCKFISAGVRGNDEENREETRPRMITKSDGTHLDAAVIVDGGTLKFALSPELHCDFLRLCCQCKAVIVCRASPIQKADIVQYVTEYTGEISLAIGDGANDVAMIQKAHVGVGISGVEGLQAACASDYAIAQFRFLKKLLFVHGAWNYDRICKLIYYSYYKNICLYIIELWFAIYSAWSGQIIYERWTIGLYNMLFTSSQPIVLGLFDRNLSQESRMRYPILYRPSKNAFSLKMFFVWVVDAFLHSIVIFWFTWFLFGDGIVWGSGMEWAGFQGGYLVLGNFIYTYVVVVVSLKSGLITRSWTVFTQMSVWGSILLWVVFLLVYSYFCSLHIYSFGAEICGIGPMVFTSPVFWVGLLVVPTTALLPDLVVTALVTTIFQSLDDAFRECEILKKDPEEVIKQRAEKELKNRNNSQCRVCMDEMYRACLSSDSFTFLTNYHCFCKSSKTCPHTEPSKEPVRRGASGLESNQGEGLVVTSSSNIEVLDSNISMVSDPSKPTIKIRK